MSYDQANLDKLPRAQLESMAALNDIGGNHKKARIALDKMDRADDAKAADDRHGEEMTAAAVANNLARVAIGKADRSIFWAIVAIVVSVVAIAVSIGLAVWQHNQG